MKPKPKTKLHVVRPSMRNLKKLVPLIWNSDGKLRTSQLRQWAALGESDPAIIDNLLCDLVDLIDELTVQKIPKEQMVARIIYECFGGSQNGESSASTYVDVKPALKLQYAEPKSQKASSRPGIGNLKRSAIVRRDEISVLWKKYLNGKPVRLRNQLVEHYRPLVHMQAARLAQKLPAQISYDEICSAGYDGLMEAVQAYDPCHKARFETFCQQRIHGAVMNWLRALDGQSRTVRRFEKQRMLKKEVLDSDLGRPPTETELAAKMGLPQERFSELSRLSRLGHKVHLSAVQTDDDSNQCGSLGGWDISDARAVDPATKVSRQVLTDYITRSLNREERLVLVLYYTEGLTMAEIGLVLDLSEARVSQIHKDVIARLRRCFKDQVSEMVA